MSMDPFKKTPPKMAALIRMMKILDYQVARCSRCGACQSVCPLYDVTRNESDVARGKLMLLDGLTRTFFNHPEGVSERLNRCLLCGSCAIACPRGVNTIEIFMTARWIMSGYRRLSPVRKAFFRKVLANPALFDRLAEHGARWQGLFLRQNSPAPGASLGNLVSPPLSHRNIVPLAPAPFHKIFKRTIPAKNSSGMRVALFTGCIIDKVYPHVADAIVKALEHHGVNVTVPAAQGCCGIPALSSGEHAAFAQMVADHLTPLDPSGFDYLVTGCATCTATIKTLWPAFFNSRFVSTTASQESTVRCISEKAHDINAFLVNIMGVTSAGKPPFNAHAPILTYHDPCHLRKTLGVFSEPRILISQNSAYRFMEMSGAQSCCGMGGSFNLTHYDLSGKIGEKKAANIEATGAGVVATGCPACMMQLSDMLARRGKNIRVAHAVEIYAEKLAFADGV
ncbi:MAG: (Fe-S)-binding protein [Desulfobacteraceae bacterium]|nr:(Fe-S)-binding protein [Desulfobacteraceae bacterium]